ncbi:hypothetical protein ACSBOB_18510 [Mesorhizobium sp. ASY16-5R]|uniref:hypothetical protein n=1 Tax=Mesorhizobium sp. ASY16-5R TaxID=3445772 RepID=UPI003FA092C8
MKRILLAVVSVLVAVAPAGAVSRYDTQRMSCANIQAALKRESPAILRFQSKQGGVPLYNLYVGSGQDCEGLQIARTRSVPAADGACPVIQCVAPPHSSR